MYVCKFVWTRGKYIHTVPSPNELSWIIEVLHTESYPWIQDLMAHYGRGLEPRLSQKYVLVVSRNDFFLDNSHYSV